MTTRINRYGTATTNAYTSLIEQPQGRNSNTSGSSTGNSSYNQSTPVQINLSPNAKAVNAQKAFSQIIHEARAALDAEYAIIKNQSGRIDNGATPDLSKLDRRSVFAIASNAESKFSTNEQSAAISELARRQQKFTDTKSSRLLHTYNISNNLDKSLAAATIEYNTLEASPEEAASRPAKQGVSTAIYNLALAEGSKDIGNGVLDQLSPMVKAIQHVAAVFSKQTGSDPVDPQTLNTARVQLSALLAKISAGANNISNAPKTILASVNRLI